MKIDHDHAKMDFVRPSGLKEINWLPKFCSKFELLLELNRKKPLFNCNLLWMRSLTNQGNSH